MRARQAILRQISEQNLDPRVPYVAGKDGKLVSRSANSEAEKQETKKEEKIQEQVAPPKKYAFQKKTTVAEETVPSELSTTSSIPPAVETDNLENSTTPPLHVEGEAPTTNVVFSTKKKKPVSG